MRILVLGAGVIGSVYAGKLLQAGHEVVLLARGRRLADLQSHGLLLHGWGWQQIDAELNITEQNRPARRRLCGGSS